VNIEGKMKLKDIFAVCLCALIAAVSAPAAEAQSSNPDSANANAGAPAPPDAPGDPANAAAKVGWDQATGALQLIYDGKLLFNGRVTGGPTFSNVTTRQGQAVTQTLTLTGKNLRLEGWVSAPDEAVTAETPGAAQQNFPLVRTTSGGPSDNLRNNAVYDRGRDWLLAGPTEATRIDPQSATQFKLVCTGDVIELTFKPRFYQRHKNIAYYRPWTYEVRKDSITGWCSWWAYKDSFNQSDLEQLLAVWKEKRLLDYGYRFIQIDDGYETGDGLPEGWLKWDGKFPSGITGYAQAVRDIGCEPGIWLDSYFDDEAVVKEHPDWFVRDAAGNPHNGRWIFYGMDSTIPEVAKTLVRPTFHGFHEAGMTYVKIDGLRHLLYDSLNSTPTYAPFKGLVNADIFRSRLEIAREEMGPNTVILSCWGVLPEVAGLADACRLGGDGYGPATMQQYNSWNGIVWRNDPDHCDVYPDFKPAQAGDVTEVNATTATAADTIIRPALASIAGCLLMLSDKADVYRDDANLEGLRRAAPVIFSVPGQLYDFDDSRSRNLVTMQRSSILTGADATPIDADGSGPVCPWWLNEFNRPFEHWNVLHRVNWSDNAGAATTVKFADLGLDPAKTYLVYEFWSHKFLGGFRDSVELPAIAPMGLASYSIREQLDRPQIASTNRHLSQGGVDLIDVKWSGSTLSGISRVVNGDRYELAIHVPAGYAVASAEFAGQPTNWTTGNELLRASFTPALTGNVKWAISFRQR
jgi:alpha-galactosidase